MRPAIQAFALLAAAFLLFCPARAAAQSAGDYVIGAQDVLAIAVFNQPALGGKYTVETDGTFTFPLVGRIKAAGLTIRQFEEELRRRFADGFFRNPQVTVAVEQYHSLRDFEAGVMTQNVGLRANNPVQDQATPCARLASTLRVIEVAQRSLVMNGESVSVPMELVGAGWPRAERMRAFA